MSEATTSDYSLSGGSPGQDIPAPEMPYRPRDPRLYRPAIGLIACGGITESHLTAYRNAGFNVVALCDLIEERAEKRREQFYPDAKVYLDYRELLARKDIEVVDIATHPHERAPIIEDALMAGKHVLSQKPFVLNLETGRRLVELAHTQGVRLAVNQNGRWAPHFSYLRHAAAGGLIGDILSVHMSVHWDHTWTVGTPFENIRELVLYDFAIHYFDMVNVLLSGRDIKSVYATKARALNQTAKPPMLAQALIEFDGGQASLIFDAHLPYGTEDRTYVGGTGGSMISRGQDLSRQDVTLYLPHGTARPELHGGWFFDGFHGTMAELLCSIEEDREPANSARQNLRSLELCFAAIASSEEGRPYKPGEVTRLPPGAAPGADLA